MIDSLSVVLPDGVAEAHSGTLTELLDRGPRVEEGDSCHEFLGYTTGMANPRRRVLTSDTKPWNVVGAIARFTWLIAGSDRLEDIAYYETRVRDYSDEGLIVPGSSYGRRIFAVAPGLNQIQGVVRELRDNPQSRRAAAVVWLPEDAVRKSRDIPCTFGLFFHIRDEALVMTTVMRSNNALTLLPYNFFEFSMVGEMVAAEIGVPFGRYLHWAASMHTFDKLAAGVGAALADTTRRSLEMPEMPKGGALDQGRELAKREAELRHAPTKEQVFAVYDEAVRTLDTYWLALFRVLFAYGLAKRGYSEARTICDDLPEYFSLGTRPVIEKELANIADDSDSLFGTSEFDLNPLGNRAALIAAAVDSDHEGSILWVARELDRLGTEYGEPATMVELLQVVEALRPKAEGARADLALAARGPEVRVVTLADVRDAFAALRAPN